MTDPILCAIGDDCRGRVIDYSKKPPEHVQLPPRDVYDRGVICGPCRHRLEKWIGDLPALHDALADALIPGNGASGGQPSYRNAWPVNPAALGLASDIYGKLARWTGDIADRRGLTKPETTSVYELATWLTRQTMWIGHWVWAPDMYHEIRELHWTVRCAAYPERHIRRFLMPRRVRHCIDCSADMYAIVVGEIHAGTMIQCSGCGREWQPIEWFQLKRRILATQTRCSA